MEEQMELTLEPAAEVSQEPAALPEGDLVEFVQAYPGLRSETIPQSVWDQVKRGEKLTHAYGRHEVRQLRASNQQLQRQLGLLRRDAEARQRALGSMRSAGSGRMADSFLTGFNDE